MNTHMWQRIQTVFLAITIVALIISLIMPVWQGQSEGGAVVLTPFYFLQKDQYAYWPYSLTAMLVVAGITLSLIEIRRYDNRIIQMKLGALNTLILAGAMVCVAVYTLQLAKQFPTGSKNGMGMYLIFVAVLCNWLAVRFIRRDERLVKDSDRLR
jgi:ABC-type cobalamin transport system permease subunit